MKLAYSCLIIFIYFVPLQAQINPQKIEIIRDTYGVPHIFAPTDAEVAYGLAWATCEDDFESVQAHLLAYKSRLAEATGKKGAVMDVIAFLIGVRELVDTAYRENIFSADFLKVLKGYQAGLNAYAQKHPKEVKLKGIFPVSEKDLIGSYALGFALFTGLPNELTKIFNGNIRQEESQIKYGSNAIAVNQNKTTDGQTYLAINSHQPLEGPFSWYEAHLQSEEGWNILGGTLPGFLSIGHGTTPNLGWAHTVNQPDFTDVYKLKMNPNVPLQYEMDGKWETLQVRTFKLKVKVGFLKISKKFTFYWSKYGTTLKKDKDFYAIRFPANMLIQAPEQQYKMNKAQNWAAFQKALQMQKMPCFNLVYADKESNIFYLSNGLLPIRNPQYDWRKVLPGNTSATLWQAKFQPLDKLPQLFNPSSGYVFNTNNTPFNASASQDNLQPSVYDPTMGFITYDNNRSLRLQELMNKTQKLSYQDFKTIKFDVQYPSKMYIHYAENIEVIFQLDKVKYPKIAQVISLLQSWDKKCDKESIGASIFLLAWHYLDKKLTQENRKVVGNQLTEMELVASLTFAQNHLRRYFKTIQVKLGDLQRHQRGEIDLPMQGGNDVIAAMYSLPNKKGRFITQQGESYICLVQYRSDSTLIETINAYGTSHRKKSLHFTDQMQAFTQQKLKPMTFDKDTIRRNAQKTYHPE